MPGRVVFCCSLLLLFFFSKGISQSSPRPNIILIMTDDQGYGDFGFTGNPHVKTPNLDHLAEESIQFENFYVSPVCAPTRSSLLTGRYSLRTGIHDTYNGGAMMSTEEITVAELLKQGGYRTGIFGKWHLGDNYPSRPCDQGFDESVIHLSGGMGQVGDFTTYFQGDSSYFNPILWHNGNQEKYDGFCSDIYTDEALKFINQNKEKPFFCYLAFNAPHTPLQAPQEYLDLYSGIDPSKDFSGNFSELNEMTEADKEAARRVYAMVTNIDDNIKKVLNALEEWGIEEETWLIFLTDNGPQQKRYKAGMRGRKGSVYRGGVRVPCLMRYPLGFSHHSTIKSVAAHLDILPTIADVCKLSLPDDRVIDGRSLLPLITGNSIADDNRSLFFYWNRQYPEKYNNMSIQEGPFKLVGHTAFNSPIDDFELYNIESDQEEHNNLISTQSKLARDIKTKLDKLYDELIQSPHLQSPPHIVIGNPAENPVILNRNDAAGERGIWSQSEVYGYWNVEIEEGLYDIRCRFIEPVNKNGRLVLESGNHLFQQPVTGQNQTLIEMKNVELPAIKGKFTATLILGRANILPFWIEIKKIDH